MGVADFVETLLATLATVAILVLMMRALGKQFSHALTSQLELKQEIVRRLSQRR